MTHQDTASPTGMEAWIIENLTEVTGIPAAKWTSDLPFEEIGLESLAITAFTARIAPRFEGLRKTFLFECRNVADVCAYLREKFPDDVAVIEGGTLTPGASQAKGFDAERPSLSGPLSGAPGAAPTSTFNASKARETVEATAEDDWPDLTLGSTLDEIHHAPPLAQSTAREPIAIIGMGGVFPGASSLGEFWDLLAAGTDLIGEIPSNRWPLKGFFEPGTNSRTSGRSYAKWGAFLDHIDTFDSQFFGISPKEARLMDPQERVFLQCAYHAMEDAALTGERFDGLGRDIGVFVGITTNSNQLNGPLRWSRGEPEIPTAMPWSAANRVSYYLDLSGPSIAVDTACSSSLVALHMAVSSLHSGQCRAALAGGVNLYLHPAKYVQLCQQHMLSPTGRCHTFSRHADGFVPGEGAGAVVLKRLGDAKADGDRIIGLIAGSATNHSGRTNGYTVPDSGSQVRLVSKALDAAGLQPEQINYIEAHGTGTRLGDPIEVAALADVLDAGPDAPACPIGSIKTNIGHLESAAGIAGLIKILLQLRAGAIAPSLNAEEISPELQIERTRFVVPQRICEWKPGPDGIRRAGISSFGAGGTCAHLIVEDHPPARVETSQAGRQGQPAQAFLFSAATPAQLRTLLQATNESISSRRAAGARSDDDPTRTAQRLAYTLQVGRRHHRARIAIAAASLDELQDAITAALREGLETGQAAGNLAQLDPESRSAVSDWLAGASVLWSRLWPFTPQPCEAPLYPFLPEYHEPMRETAVVRTPAAYATQGATNPQSRQMQLSLADLEAVLQAHRVGGEPTMPATGYLTAALAFLKETCITDALCLSRLEWRTPLTLDRAQQAPLDIARDDLSEAALASGQIRMTTQGTLHFSAALEPVIQNGPGTDGWPLPADRLERIRERCIRTASAEEAYATFRLLGLDYGPSFSAMRSARIGEREALVQVDAREPGPARVRHTNRSASLLSAAGYWDSIFQSVFFAFGEPVRDLRVPVAADAIMVQADLPPRVFVHVRRCPHPSAPGQDRFDLTVYAVEGDAPLALVSGLTYQRVEAAAILHRAPGDTSQAGKPIRDDAAQEQIAAAPDLANLPICLLARAWDPLDAMPAREAAAPDGPLLAFAANASAMAAVLHQAGETLETWVAQPHQTFHFATDERTVQLDWTRQEHLRFVFECFDKLGRSPRTILVDADAVADRKSTGHPSPGITTPALTAIREVLRACVEATSAAGRSQILLTTTDQVTASALAALTRVVAVEHPSAGFTVVWLDGGMADADMRTTTARLLELAAGSRHMPGGAGEFRLRPASGDAWRRTLTLADTGPAAEHLGRLSSTGGVILITGGSGAVGFTLANTLAGSGVKLVLLGRSAPGPAVNRKLASLNVRGASADYLQVDITDRAALERAIRSVRASYGPIGAVLHCAGTLNDGLFLGQSRHAVHEVLAPKLDGASNLDLLTRSDPLAWFIVCSGLASWHPNPGQSAYAMANGWLDGFAEERAGLVERGERSGQTRSIVWPLWDGAEGMQASPALVREIRARGLDLLKPEEAERIFQNALGVGHHAFAPVPGSRQAVAEVFALAAEAKAVIAGTGKPWSGAGVHGVAVSNDNRPEPDATSPPSAQDPQTALIGFLADTLSDVTGTPSERIDPDASLDVFGLDSILVMEMSNQLSERFPTLARTALFEAQTLRGLADLIYHDNPGEAVDLARSRNADSAVSPPAASQYDVSQHGARQQHISKAVAASPSSPGRPERQAARTAAVPLQESSQAHPEPIAIVGLAGRFPGSNSLEEFWQHLAAGHDLVTELPERLTTQIPGGPDGQKLSARWGSFIEDVECFDPLFFGISPRDAERIDPQERLFLQTAWHALEDAGYTPATLSGRRGGNAKRNRVGVTVGVMYGEYQYYAARHGAEPSGILTNSSYASIANRVSFCFDFDGPSFAVDSMCSSSLTSIHLAVSLLRSGDCDSAIAGGVNLSLHPYKYRMLEDLKFAASNGRCKSFGEGGDGYVPGEGVAAVLLKPLSSALRDGDHIHALLRASAIGHGARASGYTVPNAEAQADMISRAVDVSGVDAANLGYIEAHGTGTALGDPIELRGLSRALSARLPEGKTIPIGSVKSNIGHLEAAAGMAALTKTILQLRHGQLAPSIHAEPPNPDIDFSRTPFRVQTELQAWHRANDAPRLAAISAFGAGGSNAHLVIEEAPEAVSRPDAGAPSALASSTLSGTPELFVLSAQTADQLSQMASALAGHLAPPATEDLPLGHAHSVTDTLEGVPIADIARTLWFGRRHCDVRLAAIASSREELSDCLRQAAEAIATGGAAPIRGQSWWAGTVHPGSRTEAAPDDANRRGMSDDELGRMGALWVTGGEVNPFEPGPWRKVSLPGYVFLKRRYWVPEQATAPVRGEAFVRQAPAPASAASSSQTIGNAASASEPPRAAPQKINNGATRTGEDLLDGDLSPEIILARVRSGDLPAERARRLLVTMSQGQ